MMAASWRNARRLFLALAIVGSAVDQTQAVECYECGETSEMGSCSEFSMTQDFVKTCSGNFQSCVSTVASFGDTIVMSRECGMGEATDSCSKMRLGGASATVCSCRDNLCNKATATKGPLWSLFFTSPIILLVYSNLALCFSGL